MNLREKIEKEITEKVMTKLASQRVELGLVDDLEKAITKLSNLRDGAYGLNKDVLGLQQKLKPLLKEKEEHIAGLKGSLSFVKKAEQNIQAKFNELSKSATDLGISVNKLPVYKKYKESETLRKEIDTFFKDSKTILEKL